MENYKGRFRTGPLAREYLERYMGETCIRHIYLRKYRTALIQIKVEDEMSLGPLPLRVPSSN